MDRYFDIAQPEDLPAEAAAHLAACTDCRTVRALLDDMPDAGEISGELRNRLLAGILPSLEPARSLRASSLFIAAAVLALAALALLGAGMMGVRAARTLSGFQIAGVALPLLGAALFVARSLRRQMVPAGERSLAPSMVGAAVASVAVPAALLFSWHRTAAFVALGLRCWAGGVMLAIPAIALLLVFVRRGVFVVPARAGLTLGSLAGLSGAAGLALACPVLEAAHLCLFHSGIVIGSSGLGLLAIQSYLRLRRDRAASRP